MAPQGSIPVRDQTCLPTLPTYLPTHLSIYLTHSSTMPTDLTGLPIAYTLI